MELRLPMHWWIPSTSTITTTSTAQSVGDGSSDSGGFRLDGAWANTIAEDHLGLGSTGTLTLDSESGPAVSTSMVSNLNSTATAIVSLAVATAQLLSSTGIENLNAEVGGLGLITSVNQGVFKADATSTTDDPVPWVSTKHQQPFVIPHSHSGSSIQPSRQRTSTTFRTVSQVLVLMVGANFSPLLLVWLI